MTDTEVMDEKSSRKKKSADRHKPSRQVRIKKQFIRPLEVLAERLATSVPDEVNRGVREMLERAGLWPFVEPDGPRNPGRRKPTESGDSVEG